MNALANHQWGVSEAVDRVWAQVCGLSPESAAARLLMVFQAYIDDSYDQGGAFVLAGHIASAQSWAQFSSEWAEMLPFGVRDKRGNFHFKMAEMAANPERMERVGAFFRIIERHVLVSISVIIDSQNLQNAHNRIVADGNIDFGPFRNAYIVSWVLLMNNFHLRKEKWEPAIPLDAKVDFIFDNQAEKRTILEAWDSMVANYDEPIRSRWGSTPRFEDDKEFLPLQAADLWAWWVREWFTGGKPDGFESLDFGVFKTKKDTHTRISITANENRLVELLLKIARKIAPPHAVIMDRLGIVP